jgi:hypothetical protein
VQKVAIGRLWIDNEDFFGVILIPAIFFEESIKFFLPLLCLNQRYVPKRIISNGEFKVLYCLCAILLVGCSGMEHSELEKLKKMNAEENSFTRNP